MKVYVVSTGSYSDWSIAGIFSSQKNADAYMAHVRKITGDEGYVFGCSSDFNAVEVWTVDEALKAKMHRRYSIGVMLDSGEVKERSSFKWFAVPNTEHYIAERVPAYDGRGISRATSPKSYDHALKVASDARRVFLATGVK